MPVVSIHKHAPYPPVAKPIFINLYLYYRYAKRSNRKCGF